MRLKKLILVPRLSKSLKVVGTGTYRSATYDYLLTLHSIIGPISYRQSKIAIFPTPVYFAPPLKGFASNWVSALCQKARMMVLPGR